MSGAAAAAHLRRSYFAYLITGENGAELSRCDSWNQARALCMERARDGRGERYLIYGEDSDHHSPRCRTVLLERWIPPWFPAAQIPIGGKPGRRAPSTGKYPAKQVTKRRTVQTGKSEEIPGILTADDCK